MNARIARIIGTTVAAGGLLLGLSACSMSVSSEDVQSEITSMVKEQLQTDPTKVDCPSDLDAKVGATLTCTVESPVRNFDVVATVTAVDGSDVKFNINEV
ncbi:DUF4333 domain-containing protein [Pseudonocardia oroxyli]|jgi:hypothetical protein|uniref:DUF4333 domain-containing protein n=1 Tax=Pseudonocardia oroxyli TaxID=366584 RepID=A0A1G7GLZ3_PSEOR|nr:DUF4333 domain-containing protein [Pseudonocardia oroxyli]SDE89142.1 protein of unknown function [Pseudonocardia oroxyli]